MSTPHIHAEAMRQWAEDHAVVPPLHEWECHHSAFTNDAWELLKVPPSWVAGVTYRRVVKPIPHPNAAEMLLWAQDNQTIPPAHDWEVLAGNSATNWRPFCSESPLWHSSNTYRRVVK